MDPPSSETFAALLDENANARPDHLALIDERDTRTYKELRERADAIAGGLRNHGITQDDRVAVLIENRIEWIETMFAVHRLGATVVAVSTWATARELEYYLTHSEATAAIVTGAFAGNDFGQTLDELLNGGKALDDSGEATFPQLETVVLLGAEYPWATRFQALPGEPITFTSDPNDPADTALILYTSGSTAQPKGVPLLHGGTIENGYHIGERMHLTPADRVWLASPLFWSYGSANALSALMTHQGSMVLQAPFDPEKAYDLLVNHECTVYYGMPNMAKQIAEVDGFTNERLSLRTGTTIGQPDEVAFTIDELDVPELCNVYGATETYGNCAVTDCTLPRETRLRTQGHPLPGQDIIITDPETGDHLEEGAVGEILVGGRITPGYLNNPEENRRAFTEEGYLRMGDLGQLDEQGRIQFRGRRKNMLKIGGINVSPLEVEERLLEHPLIDQAYVVGLPDPEKNEVVGAVIVPTTDAGLTEQDIIDHCQSLAAYKRPAQVVLTSPESIPQTDTGKIQRSDLDAFFDEVS